MEKPPYMGINLGAIEHAELWRNTERAMRARGRDYLLLRWGPYHTKFEDIDGLLITEVEWRLSKGADGLATSAAAQHVVPLSAVLGAKRRRQVAIAIQRTALECFKARGQTSPPARPLPRLHWTLPGEAGREPSRARERLQRRPRLQRTGGPAFRGQRL